MQIIVAKPFAFDNLSYALDNCANTTQHFAKHSAVRRKLPSVARPNWFVLFKMKKTFFIILALLAFCFAVRLVVALNTRVISSDGPSYLSAARDFASGDYHAGLAKQAFHPLYPFLIAVFSKFIHNWEWAGMLVSIILSSLAIIPLFFISRRYLPLSVTIIACLLYCFHPHGVQLSSSIFTTGTFVGILFYALWVTTIALEKNNHIYFMLSGLLSFVMYLVRPDGVVFFILTLVMILITPLTSGKGKVVRILYLSIPWLLMLIPFLIAIKSASGIVGITGKVSIKTVTEMEIEKSFSGLYQFILDFIKGANPVPFIFFLTGAVLYFRTKFVSFRKIYFVWFIFVGFIVVFTVFAVTHGRTSKRYTVPLFLMVLPWSASGLSYLVEKINTRWVSYLLIAIVIIGLSFFTFKPLGKDKLIEKNTGQVLREYHSAKGMPAKKPLIITMLSRVAYYADGKEIVPEELLLDLIDYHKLTGTIIGKNIDYLVWDDRLIRKFPCLEQELMAYLKDRNDLFIEEITPQTSSGSVFYKIYRFR